jgi:hypothetical protein
MYRYVVVIGVIIITLANLPAEGFEVGLVGKIPPVVSIQIQPVSQFAFEAGLSGTGPLVLSLRAYPISLIRGQISLFPVIGLGVGLAFLPGDIIASGFFATIGLEVSISETPLTLFGEVSFTVFTDPPGGNPAGIGPAIGGRIDFPFTFLQTNL